MDFAALFPDLKPWVQSLATVWPAPIIKESSWIFPLILCTHLLALVTLGGAMLLPGLRLMGFGMTSLSPSAVEKATRPWLWGALIVLAVTGLLMGLVNPMKLYSRPAFLVKVIAMAAALILSLGVVRSVAGRDGVVSQNAKIMAGIALLLWLASVLIFGTSYGAAPGAFHILSVGWLIVMAFGSKLTRIVLGAITAITVVGVGIVTYGIYHPLDDYDLVMEINRWTLRLGALLIAGFLLWEFARTRKAEPTTPPLNRLIGLFTILAWFTVAAAGRWIGLSTSG
ncbi:MAG: hypothetical protein Q8R02_09440 [Hyphomonadaceae bacterium]|nr:hypothetical protein [Hyphomonadaceae bacterium]